MKREIVYTDAPPEVDEAIEYAVKHNLFIGKQEFERLLAQSKQVFAPAPQRIRRHSSILNKVAAL
jgi:hypothetical protein